MKNKYSNNIKFLNGSSVPPFHSRRRRMILRPACRKNALPITLTHSATKISDTNIMNASPQLRARLDGIKSRLDRSRAFKLLIRYWALIATVAWAGLAVTITRAEFGEFIDANVTRPFYFKMRETLNRDPVLDPKFKILSYDDGSVDTLQRPDLTIDDWATVLAALGKQKPRIIFIDKVFGIIFDPLGRKEEAIATLASMDVPVVVGAFAAEAEKKTRSALDLDKPYYTPNAAVDDRDNPYKNWFVYGPNPELAKAFRGAGSILYHENGVASAFLPARDGHVVPHIALFGAAERHFADGRLVVDGIRLPVNRKGQVIVDFPRESKFYARAKRLGNAVISARRGEPIRDINEGDTVLILPEMFSGSTDFKFTPLGLIPGGFIVGSLINSVLSKTWLSPLPGKEWLVIALCLVGALWGRFILGLRYWIGQVIVSLAALSVCVYLFAYHSQVISALMPLVGFWGCSLLTFAEATRGREKEADRLRDEINDAAEIAKAFRPDAVPDWERFAISAYHRSFTEASGDWYAFRTSPSGRYHHFIMCDITGHGVQAAMVVSICKTMLVLAGRSMLTTLSDADAHKLDDRDFLQQYAQELNAMLFYHGKGQHLVTMLGFTFDNERDELIYISAGHPSPMLYSPSAKGERKFSLIALRSTVLGLADTASFKPLIQKLHSGDEIIAYTDGLPINRHVRRVNRFFKDHAYDFSGAPKTLLDAVWQSEFEKSGKTLDDDVSIVWFKARFATAPEPSQAPSDTEQAQVKT